MSQKNREILTAVLLGGLIAAAIDIGAASLINGRSPARIMQAIAGGLLGKASFDGGVATVILGAVLQEMMGVLIATIYVVVSKTTPGLLRRWIPSGLLYGVIIFFVMNYVVLPLSAWKSAPHFTSLKFAENMAAMLLFGLIVAFFARRLVSAPRALDGAATPA
jgi:uncharacterized membrane protein YagU involved in acid resistance